MAIFDKLLKDGYIFKATPRTLGNKEFLTIGALDPRYGNEWSELGIGFLTFIQGAQVKTIWHYKDDVFPYPVAISEGSLVQLSENNVIKNVSGTPRMVVSGVIDIVKALDYDFVRLVPQPIEPKQAPAPTKK
jgi:hypothetical protein